MAPSGAMASAPPSSWEVSARPTSLPSKYIAQLPAVVSPSEAGVSAMTSSSSPLTPFAVEGRWGYRGPHAHMRSAPRGVVPIPESRREVAQAGRAAYSGDAEDAEEGGVEERPGMTPTLPA